MILATFLGEDQKLQPAQTMQIPYSRRKSDSRMTQEANAFRSPRLERSPADVDEQSCC